MRTILRATMVMVLGFVGVLTGKADSARTADAVTLDQAVEAARRHILAKEENISRAEIADFTLLPLDPQTWGKNYWAIEFPRHGKTQYHVSKVTGFVLEIHALQADPTQGAQGYASPTWNLSPGLARRLPMPSLKMRERWADYLITVSFPQALALEREEIGFGCQLWEASERVQPYHHQEYKEVLLLKSVNQVRTLTLIISKPDAARFPIIDIYLLTADSGFHLSPKITEIRDE